MNHDHLRTEEMMTQEAVNLVSDMAASSPSSVTFAVGGKVEDYRRIFRNVIEQQRLILLEDTPELICFGWTHKEPCTITYLPS